MANNNSLETIVKQYLLQTLSEVVINYGNGDFKALVDNGRPTDNLIEKITIGITKNIDFAKEVKDNNLNETSADYYSMSMCGCRTLNKDNGAYFKYVICEHHAKL